MRKHLNGYIIFNLSQKANSLKVSKYENKPLYAKHLQAEAPETKTLCAKES